MPCHFHHFLFSARKQGAPDCFTNPALGSGFISRGYQLPRLAPAELREKRGFIVSIDQICSFSLRKLPWVKVLTLSNEPILV